MVQLGQQLLRNIFSSWGGYAARLIITFFFVPYIASILGDARYGVWVIIFQTIAYFSLLDLGLSSALTRYVSRYLREHDFEKINRVLSTSGALYLLVGTLVFAGIYLFVQTLFAYFKIGDPVLIEEGKTALLILGAFMAFNSYLLPFGNSLSAFQRHDIALLLVTGEELIRVLIMVWFLSQGYGLVALALVTLCTSVLRHLVGGLWLRRLHPEVRMRPANVGTGTARMLIGYSRISFAITLCWLVIFNTDTFLLGLLSSSAAAGIYNPAAQLMLYLRNIVNSIGAPLVPAVSHVEAGGDIDKVRSVYVRGIKYVSYISWVFTVGIIVYADAFVGLWLPPEFSEAATVMVILSVGSAFLLPQIIGISILFGIERHRYLLSTLVIESLAKIILSIVLIPRYDLIGMALANSIPQVILYTTLYPITMARALRMETKDILVPGLVRGAVGACLSLPAALLLRRLVPPVSWPALAIDVLIVAAIVILVGYFLLEPGDRLKVKSLIGKTP